MSEKVRARQGRITEADIAAKNAEVESEEEPDEDLEESEEEAGQGSEDEDKGEAGITQTEISDSAPATKIIAESVEVEEDSIPEGSPIDRFPDAVMRKGNQLFDAGGNVIATLGEGHG